MAWLSVLLVFLGLDTQLPDDWLGAWKGICEVTSAKGVQKVPMKLTIRPLSGRAGYTWEIVYDEGEKAQTRGYELLPAVPAASGHFIVDEKNGVKLDTYLVGPALISSFKVDSNLLTTRFERKGDSIVVEMITFDMAAPTSAKVGQNEIASYKRKALQSGVLKRVKE